MAGPTKAELLEEAATLGVDASEDMTKAEIKAALETPEAPAVAEEAVTEAVETEEAVAEEAVAEEVEPEPYVDPFEAAPVVSQEPTTQGGLTFLTDRAQ